jgi:hypothetical protein
MVIKASQTNKRPPSIPISPPTPSAKCDANQHAICPVFFKIYSKKCELFTQVNRGFWRVWLLKNGGFIEKLVFELQKRLLKMPIFGFFDGFYRYKWL